MKKIAFFLIFLASLTPPGFAQYNEVKKASVPTSGSKANGDSFNVAISANDGRYIAFESTASNLVASDTNAASDIFLFDRQSGTVSRVSVDSAGTQVTGASTDPSISGDGRYVVFTSLAQLVTTDTNSVADIYLKDTSTGAITRLSVKADSSGTQVTGTYTVNNPVISKDGSVIAFETDAKLETSDTNSSTDVYVYVRATGPTSIDRISTLSTGTQLTGTYSANRPSLSTDGQYVAYESTGQFDSTHDTNLSSDIYRFNRSSSAVDLISVISTGAAAGDSSSASISGDGNIIAFASTSTGLKSTDTNGVSDIFVRNVTGATTTRISESTVGAQANGASSSPAISSAGRYVAFISSATNLVSGDANGKDDVFVNDLQTGTTVRASVRKIGGDTDGTAVSTSISSNAQYVAFPSDATNLVSPDANDLIDAFVENTDCTVAPAGTTPIDTDGDSTTNCSDGCGEDATKTSPGQCGCGTPDTDSDSDGTANCNDACPSDSTKTSEGRCGCGVSDADNNGNGFADACVDPSSSTTPKAAKLESKKSGAKNTVIVKIPDNYRGVYYRVTLSKVGDKSGKSTKTINTKLDTRLVKFAKLSAGTYKVSYRVFISQAGTEVVTSLGSPQAKITVK